MRTDPQSIPAPAEDEPIVLPDAEGIETEEEGDVAHYQFKLSKNLTRRIDQYLVDRVPISRATTCSG